MLVQFVSGFGKGGPRMNRGVIFIDSHRTRKVRWGHSPNYRAAWSRAHNWKTGWSELRQFQTLQQHGRSSRKQRLDTWSKSQKHQSWHPGQESQQPGGTQSRTGQEPTLHTHHKTAFKTTKETKTRAAKTRGKKSTN